MRLNITDVSAYDRMIGRIYDTALSPASWPDLLGELAVGFGCHYAGNVTTNADRSDPRGFAFGVDESEHHSFLHRFHRRNAVAVRVAQPRTGQVIRGEELMSRHALEQTEMYQVYFRPNRIGHALRLTIWHDDTGAQQSISLARPWTAVGFEAEDLRLAKALMPHLCRAVSLGRLTQHTDLRARAAHAALETFNRPVLTLARDRRVLHANLQAEAILGAADGLSISRGRLLGATSAASNDIDRLVGIAVQHGAGGMARLPRPSNLPALVLLAIPIRQPAYWFYPDQPAALLCVSDPASRQDADQHALIRLFGLTRAEAALAGDLLAGTDLTTIAAGSGRSVNTVRNLLARLMAKTETHRQAELLRLLAAMPKPPTGH